MANPPLAMTADIFDDDDEMDRILSSVEDEQFDAVDIGVLSDSDEIVRIYASANEFGTRNGDIPERSYIRSAVEDNAALIDQKSDRLWGQIIDGTMTKQQGLQEMGEFIQRLITRRITTLRMPPNAPSTIARKKSSNPLIDTGRLRASIRFELVNSSDGEGGI